MADICDLAQDHIEREEAARAAQRASQKRNEPKPNGACHNCGEVVADGHLFCDTDCRSDWERTQRAAAQKPRD